MKRILLLTAAIVLGTAVSAQQGNLGGHFFENWDDNADGQVTLAEATTKRGEIFFTFDEDDDGVLSASDYITFNEARDNDHATMKEAGRGQGHGPDRENQGMTMDFNDVNGDGQVSRDEFISRTHDWFAMMDRNDDGTITAADFGRGN